MIIFTQQFPKVQVRAHRKIPSRFIEAEIDHLSQVPQGTLFAEGKRGFEGVEKILIN
jgi:hypothetical protein